MVWSGAFRLWETRGDGCEGVRVELMPRAIGDPVDS